MRRGAKPKKREKGESNRLNFAMTIVFLLVGSIVYKLFVLQVIKGDYYLAAASNMHEVKSSIDAKRGRIFMQDTKSGSEKYLLATNKDFAYVFAVPGKIVDTQRTVDSLYEIFDREQIERDVDTLIENDPMFKFDFASTTATSTLSTADLAEKERLDELKRVRREEELKKRKDEKLGEYWKKFEDKSDPFVPIRRKVDEDVMKKIKDADLPGIEYYLEPFRYYPEKEIGSQLVGFVSEGEEGMKGRYGLEGFFNDELSGRKGLVKVEKGAKGGVLIVSDREVKEAKNGSDLVLTIERSIEYTVCKKLEANAMKHGADSGTIIVMEPFSGAIIAMCSWPNYDPNNFENNKDINLFNNPAIFDSYEPGSIFKVITMAAGIDQEKITPNTFYDDKGFVMVEGWPKPIKNSDFATHGGHGRVNMSHVLNFSLNTGTVYISNKLGPDTFVDYVKKFGFGEKTGIELETEGVSNINSMLRDKIRPVELATASFGQGITATPLQMISSYAAVANGGLLMKPYLVDEIITADGQSHKTQPVTIRRVISEKTAATVGAMMVNVLEDGHTGRARVKGYYVGGKTGTAQVAEKGKYGTKTIHTFIGLAPVDEPKFVMLIRFDDPKDVQFADSSAAPLFSELAEYILNYYEVPKERED